jgi:hypothetical protein
MSQSESLQLKKQTITFSNGNETTVVTAPLRTSAEAIVGALGVNQPKALIVVAGGADKLDDTVKPKLLQLLSRGVARVAVGLDALILDGGTKAGVMELMGEAISDCEEKVTLLGVVPSGKAIYPGGPSAPGQDTAELDPNHTHFALVQCDQWGCETRTMFTLAKYLGSKVPVVTVVVDGGSLSKEEVRQSVRQKWPIIVVEKTGRLADEIAAAWKQKGKAEAQVINDTALAEIVADGNISLFNLDGSVEAFRELLGNNLCVHSDECLRDAWSAFAAFDFNAKKRQKSFNRLQTLILLLGIVASALALMFTQFKPFLLAAPAEVTAQSPSPYNPVGQALNYVIIVLPILISVMVAGSNRFRAGNKWVLLRSSAESIKGEIFGYRTGTNKYRRTPDITPECELQKNLQNSTRRLMQTEVNRCGLLPYTDKIPPEMYGAAADDDGFSSLSPEQYVKIRLGDQLGYYKKKTVKLETTLQRMQWSIYGLGGIGTFLAAVGLQLWIALTITIVGVITVYLEFQQVENSLVQYNQTAADLENLKSWWASLSSAQKQDPKNYDKLVDLTETALHTEMSGWTQRMENALADLYAKETEEQKKKTESEEKETPEQLKPPQTTPGQSSSTSPT